MNDVNSNESHILHTCAKIKKIQIFSNQYALNAPELSEGFRKLLHMTTGNLS